MAFLSVTILGVGCRQHKKLLAHLQSLKYQAPLHLQIQETSDVEKFLQFNLSKIPSLKVNGKIILQGVVPSKAKLYELLVSELINS